jgi:hypothetical protein
MGATLSDNENNTVGLPIWNNFLNKVRTNLFLCIEIDQERESASMELIAQSRRDM